MAHVETTGEYLFKRCSMNCLLNYIMGQLCNCFGPVSMVGLVGSYLYTFLYKYFLTEYCMMDYVYGLLLVWLGLFYFKGMFVSTEKRGKK